MIKSRSNRITFQHILLSSDFKVTIERYETELNIYDATECLVIKFAFLIKILIWWVRSTRSRDEQRRFIVHRSMSLSMTFTGYWSKRKCIRTHKNTHTRTHAQHEICQHMSPTLIVRWYVTREVFQDIQIDFVTNFQHPMTELLGNENVL